MTHYGNRDIEAQGPFYIAHVEALTAENLTDKSDIAAELAHRDMLIAELNSQISALKIDLIDGISARRREM